MDGGSLIAIELVRVTPGLFAIGGISRDHVGNWIAVFSGYIGFGNALKSLLWAIASGIKVAISIRYALRNFSDVKLPHTIREGNQCADNLAKLSLLNCEPYTVYQNILPFLKIYFLADLHGLWLLIFFIFSKRNDNGIGEAKISTRPNGIRCLPRPLELNSFASTQDARPQFLNNHHHNNIQFKFFLDGLLLISLAPHSLPHSSTLSKPQALKMSPIS
ncbi:ribonuclease H [Senna tora]|uniref:Ribonuclease H n=1 Tax=Senna tora TaxID=362788 RepID=A0A834WTP7_9FABA|nr:ribonuclease H [Senna tora]